MHCTPTAIHYKKEFLKEIEKKDLFNQFESSDNLDYKCIKLHFKSD